MQQSDVYYQLLSQHVSGNIMPIFRRTKTVLLHMVFWFCWMWFVAVVGRCVVGCERSGGQQVLASYNAATHNRYQPHPAEPEQYTICYNTVFDLLKMGIMMPETC
jgi:hypothetical protein